MRQLKILGAFGLLVLLSQNSHARSDLWVSGKDARTTAKIEIPSLAPLVKARESAVLVVYTVSGGLPSCPCLFPLAANSQVPGAVTPGKDLDSSFIPTAMH